MYHSHLIHRSDVVVVVVDVQEKLFPLMQERELLAQRLALLVEGSVQLALPIICTEQYSKGLGSTIAEILQKAPNARVIGKDTFSCFGSPEFAQALRETERRQVLFAGIETHICVLQSCFDAKAQGYDVFLAADAVSSRLPHTTPIALDRLRSAGVAFSTVEGFLFEVLETRQAAEFKPILGLVREGS